MARLKLLAAKLLGPAAVGVFPEVRFALALEVDQRSLAAANGGGGATWDARRVSLGRPSESGIVGSAVSMLLRHRSGLAVVASRAASSMAGQDRDGMEEAEPGCGCFWWRRRARR